MVLLEAGTILVNLPNLGWTDDNIDHKGYGISKLPRRFLLTALTTEKLVSQE